MAGSYGTGTYKIENFEAVAKVIVTNTVPVDAYRGYGRPEAAYIAERTIEAVARRLDLDPVEVRRINFVPPTDFPYRPYGSRSVIYDSGNYQGCLDRAIAAFDYTSRREEQQRLRSAGRYRGIGVAAYTEMCGMAPSRRLAAIGFDRGGWESARIAIDSSGRTTLYSGSMSQGHGHATALAQIAADVLQMPVENIDVVQAHVCAGRIVAKAKKIAAQMMEVAAEDIAFESGSFSVPGTNIEPLPFAKVARMAHLGHILPDGMEPGLDETLFYDPTGMGAPSGVHIAYVEVDPDTGMVEILDYVAVDDAGTIINPLLARGQIHGGVVQGIGQALYEEARYDRESGQLLTGSLLDYAVPHADSLPEIRSQFQETPSPTNPLGVKGIGESGAIGAPPTIVHAVLDALAPFGITHLDMPLTPQKVWSAIRDAHSPGGM
jgi:carbon-monoxide dehydrogenase large subunit